ncbi:hypothetical protein [Fibrobacter sp.]|uniref:hypothetical protein n=1 Tax=Fibrobacter sp. TaxID=35828 RepID=UPI0025BA4006|nr:hypothetical protein [Fibrobacter sp.]MBS7270965.1 hypothetical protein [Fibrobacter sp.]MCI6438794.1 hypothetical protein [Fibrobacter sp.]MDD7498564.1 hypothetical protein [Fibrobacter sp.]MDY5723137.1 hypothetical protein [Fibrobacter sp.]
MGNCLRGYVAGRRGAVLPLVLGILLAVTLLLTSLLQMPGGVRRGALRQLQKQQRIYDAESALIANLSGLPADFFERPPWNRALPKVDRGRLGPWAVLSAPMSSANSGGADKRIRILAGVPCDSACSLLNSYERRREIYEGFRQELIREISMAKPPLALKVKSGNRRFLGRMQPMSLWVQEGDLTLNLDGMTSSGRFRVDGSAEVRGNVNFDTLRVYARGPITLRGNVRARWLEAFSEDRIEISQGLEFSGVVVARREVLFPNGARKVRRRYPSFAMSLESGNLGLDSMLIPAFISGQLQPFEWSLK